MKTVNFWIVCLLSLFTVTYHGTALAAFDDVFYRNPGDMSIQYLGSIFGIVGNALIGDGNNVLKEIFRVFNIVVLSLGTIVVVYTVVASTLNTAQEGEVMGKKWSSMWLPLRSAGGLAILLPTSSGYSLIQIMMMTIILKGVDAGNAVYNTVLDRAGEGQGLTATQTVSNSLLKTQTITAFKIATCVAYINKNNSVLGGDLVSVYRSGSKLLIGSETNPAHKDICGTVNMSPNPNPAKITAASWQDAELSSGEAALSVASSYASEAAQNDPAMWITSGAQINIARSMKTPLVSVNVTVTSDYQSILTEAKKAGWIFAGVNYFKLLSPDGVTDVKPPPPMFTYNEDALNNLGYEVNGMQLGTFIKKQAADYLNATDGATTIENTEGTMLSRVKAAGLNQITGDAGDWAGQIVSSAGLGDSFETIRDALVSGDGDALSSMRKIGSEIMQSIETAFWVTLGVTVGIAVLVCFFAGLQPVCSMFFTLISMLIPVLLFFMTLLWSVGVLLGLYIPMIPYLVFTFGALAWMIMVIEAIVAAPIVSLGLVTPSGENLGKASPAVLLIANIFMRPSLMVIGMVIAARLLDVSVQMLNFGFNYFMVTIGAGSYGFFASIALLIVYGGIVIALAHECFTLIHVLPDKVNRWIGGHAEQSNVAKQMGEMQKTVQTASQTSLQIMQAGTKAIGEVKTIVEKTQEVTGAGGGAGGPPGGAGKPPGGLQG